MPDPTNDAASDDCPAALAELPLEERELFGRFLSFLASAGSPPLDVVRARRVEVVDDRGLVRVLVGNLAGGHAEVFGIGVYDARGGERAALALGEPGPLLSFSLHGDDALVLGVDDPETTAMRPGPYLELLRRSGDVAVGWRVDDESGAVEIDGVDATNARSPGAPRT